MKILAIEVEKEGTSSADFQPHLHNEAMQVWKLVQADVVREVYFEPSEHTAILILECLSIDEAKTVLESLPLVRAGLIHFDLKVLEPYSGFARLFRQNESDT